MGNYNIDQATLANIQNAGIDPVGSMYKGYQAGQDRKMQRDAMKQQSTLRDLQIDKEERAIEEYDRTKARETKISKLEASLNDSESYESSKSSGKSKQEQKIQKWYSEAEKYDQLAKEAAGDTKLSEYFKGRSEHALSMGDKAQTRSTKEMNRIEKKDAAFNKDLLKIATIVDRSKTDDISPHLQRKYRKLKETYPDRLAAMNLPETLTSANIGDLKTPASNIVRFNKTNAELMKERGEQRAIEHLEMARENQDRSDRKEKIAIGANQRSIEKHEEAMRKAAENESYKVGKVVIDNGDRLSASRMLKEDFGYDVTEIVGGANLVEAALIMAAEYIERTRSIKGAKIPNKTLAIKTSLKFLKSSIDDNHAIEGFFSDNGEVNVDRLNSLLKSVDDNPAAIFDSE